MANYTISVADIIWRHIEDYADQTATLTALTTTHHHFCPFTCTEGHDEEHILLLYFWDYLDWFRRQYQPPFFTTAQYRTVMAFRGRSIIPPGQLPKLKVAHRINTSFVFDSWITPTISPSPFMRGPRPILPCPTREGSTDEVGSTSHLIRG
jgi:hypothetical protein